MGIQAVVENTVDASSGCQHTAVSLPALPSWPSGAAISCLRYLSLCISQTFSIAHLIISVGSPVVISDCPQLDYWGVRDVNVGKGTLGYLPTSPWSFSTQIYMIFESELQPISRTLYPHFLELPSTLSCTPATLSTLNSALLNPFLSNITTSCRPSLPDPPPGNPYRCVLTIQLPEGRHERECSSPGVGSDVLCKMPVCEYMRTLRRRCSGALELGSLGSLGESEDTAKKAPSPRQLMQGSSSSSGLGPTTAGFEACAATFLSNH